METMFDQQNKWKLSRLGKFTASEIYKLLTSGRKKDEVFGKTAMTYIMEKLAEIITGERKDDLSGLKALEWGAANELDAILSFEKHIGRSVEYFGVATPKFFEYTWNSGGSPDGLMDDAVVESKCPYVSAVHVQYLAASYANRGNDWLKDFSPEYYAQAQFNMMCTKRDKCYFVSYDPRTVEHKHRLAVLTIYPDAELQNEIKYRIAEASKIIASYVELLDQTPSVVLVSRNEDGVMIAEKAIVNDENALVI